MTVGREYTDRQETNGGGARWRNIDRRCETKRKSWNHQRQQELVTSSGDHQCHIQTSHPSIKQYQSSVRKWRSADAVWHVSWNTSLWDGWGLNDFNAFDNRQRVFTSRVHVFKQSGRIITRADRQSGGASVRPHGPSKNKLMLCFIPPWRRKRSPNDAIIQEFASRQSPVTLWKVPFVVLISLNAIQQFSVQNIRA